MYYVKSQVFTVLVMTAMLGLSGLWSTSLQAQNPAQQTQSEPTNGSDDSLSAARDQLEQAFSSYRDKNIEATREHLLQARSLLDQSALNSASQTVKTEAAKLVDEIQAFEQKLAAGNEAEEGSIARFWRRATSFIRREAEQLVDQYVELSQNEKTFKHLLDAKMHLFIAEHDLFVSHDSQDAFAELDKVLVDLDLASQEAVADFRPRVDGLTDKVTALQQLMTASEESWLGFQVIMHLQNATSDLVKAEQAAKPETSLQIGIIRHQLEGLRREEETRNLRNEYDKIMEDLKLMISKLETE